MFCQVHAGHICSTHDGTSRDCSLAPVDAKGIQYLGDDGKVDDDDDDDGDDGDDGDVDDNLMLLMLV